MNLLRKIFDKRKREQEIPRMSSWDKVVEMMYNQNLDAFADEIVRVVYSKDKTMRYVVLRDEKGLFTYQLEAIYQFDKDEWKYIFSNKDSLPAMWEPFQGVLGKSVFLNEDELLKEIKAEPEYRRYFI